MPADLALLPTIADTVEENYGHSHEENPMLTADSALIAKIKKQMCLFSGLLPVLAKIPKINGS